MYQALSSLYSNSRSRVILNKSENNYLQCSIGVKKGDCLSPTLLDIFINDLAHKFKAPNIGISLNDTTMVTILLYADDIILLACSSHCYSLWKTGVKGEDWK
jgi:hypothetical protein